MNLFAVIVQAGTQTCIGDLDGHIVTKTELQLPGDKLA
jgi:hypothetical protein